MYKMVIQAVLFSAMALGFIVFKSDGLRMASRSGDISHLASGTQFPSDFSLSGKGEQSSTFGGASPWYEKLDPRRLWAERPKTVKLAPKTIKVKPVSEQGDLAAQLAAKNLDPDVVGVVTLK